MRIKRDRYERHEALSPTYQGWKVNPLPMLYTIFTEHGLEPEVMDEVLLSVRESLGLFELSDPTYPVSDIEQEYVNRTSYYLGQFHELGLDVVLGSFLSDKEDTICSLQYLPLARLAYAKRSQNEMLIAQAIAFYEVIYMTYSLRGSTVSKEQFQVSLDGLKLALSKRETFSLDQTVMDRFDQLILDNEIKNCLFVDRNIGSDPVDWLRFLLQYYMETTKKEVLYAAVGLNAFLQLEELFADSGTVLRQWMLSSQLYLLTSDIHEPMADTKLVEWDIMLANMHLSEHVQQVLFLQALYELYHKFGLNECQVIASYIYTNLG